MKDVAFILCMLAAVMGIGFYLNYLDKKPSKGKRKTRKKDEDWA